MRRGILASLPAAALAAAVASTAVAGGPPAVGFYVDGETYRTIATPTDLSGTGAPLHSFDRIFDLGGAPLLNVAEAKPGDRDYNGGRWMVLPVEWHVTPYQLTSAEEVWEAEANGELTVSYTPAKLFVCPVIKKPGNA